MVKQIYLVSIHSIIDVVTNSSSDLFVCDTTKTLEVIREMLQDLLDLHNKHTGNEEGFNDMFGRVWMADNIQEVDRQLKCYFDKEEIDHFYDFKDNIIVIESSNDNSIPFVIQEWIEDIFKAERYHLG